MLARSLFRVRLGATWKYLEKSVITPRNLIIAHPRRLLSATILKLNSQTRERSTLVGESDGNPNCKKVLGKLEGKLRLSFTCKKCKTRNQKFISKVGYERGVIIIRCDGCKNNHLIADNLGWFPELKGNKNIEQILATKGEKVRRIMDYDEGYFEAVAEEEFDKMKNQAEMSQVDVNGGDFPKLEYEKVGTPVKT